MNPVVVKPDDKVITYWQARLAQHADDTYRGRSLVKFPEDLRTYQHLIEQVGPDSIIELGTWRGGSALWFADQLTVLCGGGHVITVDRAGQGNQPLRDHRITFVSGDLRGAVDEVEGIMVERGLKRPILIEDSAHTFENTLAALRLYQHLVPKGSYVVVEDTIVDTDISIWPNVHGSGLAVTAFLEENDRFDRVPFDLYGLTMHMGGWLQARR